MDKMPPKRLEMGKYGLVASFILLLASNRMGFVVSHEYANEVHSTPQQVQRTSYHFQPLKNWMNGNIVYKYTYKGYILPICFTIFPRLFIFFRIPISALLHILTLLFVFFLP